MGLHTYIHSLYIQVLYTNKLDGPFPRMGGGAGHAKREKVLAHINKQCTLKLYSCDYPAAGTSYNLLASYSGLLPFYTVSVACVVFEEEVWSSPLSSR